MGERRGRPELAEAGCARQSAPPPHDDSGHTWRHPDAQLADIIRNGFRDPFNQTSDLTMPPFEGVLTDEEIVAVIAYFESLPPGRGPSSSRMRPRAC